MLGQRRRRCTSIASTLCQGIALLTAALRMACNKLWQSVSACSQVAGGTFTMPLFVVSSFFKLVRRDCCADMGQLEETQDC